MIVTLRTKRIRTLDQIRAFVDAALLAEVDEAIGQLSGCATRVILQRTQEVCGDARFARLTSVANGRI